VAGEGAVLFLEMVSPALCDVDSSSGALGNAMSSAVASLVPVSCAAPVAALHRSWVDNKRME